MVMGIKTNDPQTRFTTFIKKSKLNPDGAELLTFTLRLGFFELAFICPLPDEGQTTGTGYAKYKLNLNASSDAPQQSRQTRQDREDVRDDNDTL